MSDPESVDFGIFEKPAETLNGAAPPDDELGPWGEIDQMMSPNDARANGAGAASHDVEQDAIDTGPKTEVRLGLDFDRVVHETIAVLARAPNTYSRGGILVRVVCEPKDKRILRETDAPTIRAHTVSTLELELAGVANFTRFDAGQNKAVACAPTQKLLKTLLDVGAWPDVRPLRGLASAPIMRPDGSVAQMPGYDVESGYLLAFDPRSIVRVEERPARGDAMRARDALLAVVQDFPFEDEAHRSGWLGLLLTLLVRTAIDGPCPMFMFTANVRGAGKSRLVDCAAIIATGRIAPRATQPSDDAEAGKVLTSIVMAGDELLLLDNVDRPLGGAKLDALLTGERWKDRVLGVNKMIDLAIRVILCATGNNIELRGDTIRRVLPVRLDSPEERPEDRRDFAIRDLLAHVRQHRHRMVANVLTILRAWYVEQCPKLPDVAVWGSFEAWSDLVPHVLRWIDLPDPQKARDGLERDDPKQGAMRAIRSDWQKVESACGVVAGVTIREAIDKLYPKGDRSPDTSLDDLRAALETLAPGKGAVHVDASALGRIFRTERRRVRAGKRLINEGETGGGVARWTVR